LHNGGFNQPNMNELSNDISILLVDHSIGNLIILQSALEEKSINIYTCSSSRDALKICSQHTISIAIIEVQMPELSGFELLTILKNNPATSHIIVVLMTRPEIHTNDIILGLNNGAVDYVFKPLDLYITKAKIKSLMILIRQQQELQFKNVALEVAQGELYQAMEIARESKVIKENFLANMSHEIRTPLNAIVAITHLIQQSPCYPNQSEMLKLMDFSSNALLGIVNDILQSSQIDAGKINILEEEVNIIDLCHNVGNLTRPMAADKGLDLCCHIEENVPGTILTDGLRINQVLINLINNAIKFTTSGSIVLALTVLTKEERRVQLQFRVTDTGPGITATAIRQIFDRFEQLEDRTWQKFGGTGLGLSIVKRLVQLMGGEIEVESQIGKGTSFIFNNWYPIAANQSLANISLTDSVSLTLFQNIRILLAEDNLINQFVAIKILEKWNLQVDVACNGQEAFDMVKAKHYDLILMDTHMPVLNGILATKKIRNELIGPNRNIPIVSFSASVIEHEKREALDAGVNDFIEKPFDPKALHGKISRLLAVK
jgi:signal transduction histidine kinase